MATHRACELIGVIGTNGTGKSTAVRKIITAIGSRSLVFTPHDNEWEDCPVNELVTASDFNFKGICRHIFPMPETLERTEKCFFNGSLVFEELRDYVPAATNFLMRRFLISRRQHMNDIIFVCHGFSEIPPAFLTFISRLVLFRTTDSIDRRKRELQQFDRLREAQTRINGRALTEPYYHEVIKL
ncbi:MAG: hypothetical protein LBI89_03945 [Prevotellaceae bacterium]|jgi:hypothetical protein|nr:hypothetical protein [Prevotellaceae bacterium]